MTQSKLTASEVARKKLSDELFALQETQRQTCDAVDAARAKTAPLQTTLDKATAALQSRDQHETEIRLQLGSYQSEVLQLKAAVKELEQQLVRASEAVSSKDRELHQETDSARALEAARCQLQRDLDVATARLSQAQQRGSSEMLWAQSAEEKLAEQEAVVSRLTEDLQKLGDLEQELQRSQKLHEERIATIRELSTALEAAQVSE